MLCDDLEACGGGAGGREAQERGYIYLQIADSPCFTAETDTTL